MASWGLDGDALRERNPRLVSCSITAFGSVRARRRAARLRPAAAGDGRAHERHRRGRRAAAEGRRGGRGPRLRAARGGRDRGGAGRARAHRRRPPRRDLAAGLGADLAAQPGLGLGVGGRRARAPRQPPPEHRAVRDLRGRRPPVRASRSATTACSRGCARRSGCPSCAGDERFATNTARVAQRDALGEALEARLRARSRPTTGSSVLRAANVPVGPINDVSEAYALAESLGLEPILEADGVPLARPPVGTLRRRPPRLDEHGDEIRGDRRGDRRRARRAPRQRQTERRPAGSTGCAAIPRATIEAVSRAHYPGRRGARPGARCRSRRDGLERDRPPRQPRRRPLRRRTRRSGRYAPRAAMACRTVFGSMKRTSSRMTSNSETSSVPRSRKNATRRWTSSSGALAPEVMPTTRLPSSHSSRTWRLVVDQVRLGAEVARDVDEALRVRRVLRPDDEHEVALAWPSA